MNRAAALLAYVVVISLFAASAHSQNESGPVAVPVRKKGGAAKAEKKQDTRGSAPINLQAFDAQLLSELIFRYTNNERRRAGIGACGNSPQLAQSATAHSADMAGRGYFSHNGGRLLSRTDVSDRVRATGLTHYGAAENISMQPVYDRLVTRSYTSPQGQRMERQESEWPTYDQMARTVVEQWMGSPGHQRNIMDPSLNALGVGCAVGQSQGFPYIYFTQNFARLPAAQ